MHVVKPLQPTDRGARKVIELDDGDHGIVCLCEWDGRQWVVIDDNYDRRIAVHPAQPRRSAFRRCLDRLAAVLMAKGREA